MAKVLLLNGSPRMERSNTLRLARAFTEGMAEANPANEISEISIYEKNIEFCRGCFNCWRATPGKCVIDDDMADALKLFTESDIIIWSMPLYHCTVPSKVKSFMERMLPLNYGKIHKTSADTSGHTRRVDLSVQKHVLICTSGFSTKKSNYEPLIDFFSRYYGADSPRILCPEGELFSVPEMEPFTGKYLAAVKQAGREYAKDGGFSTETAKALDELVIPEELFIQLANGTWAESKKQ